MNRRIFAILGLIVLGIGIFWGGAVFAQSRWAAAGWQPGWMMDTGTAMQPGPGFMHNGHGMTAGPGMMSGGMMSNNMMGGGMMMGNYGVLAGVEPLSIEEAETAIGRYLDTLNNDRLVQGEIMIFDNHAYGQILDESSGKGAFEVLVDPVSGNVYPEPGPNMMWNTEYGMMAGSRGQGLMGGHMMGNFGSAVNGTITVSAEEAYRLAQEYLDANLPGKTADEHVDPFPGYYTLHVLEDGKVVGMLSVNAYSGQVFLHHWHGAFIEMSAAAHN